MSMAPPTESRQPDLSRSNQEQSSQEQVSPAKTLLQTAMTPVVSTHDRGFLYGDGVFETVRFCGGKLQLWTLHRGRLLKSCDMLVIPLPLQEFDQIVSDAIALAPAQDCILKIIVTRGEGGRGYAPPQNIKANITLQWHALPAGTQELSQQGIDCIYCDHPLSVNPVTAGIKHLNRLDQVMASVQLSQAAQYFPAIREGLMSDGGDYVLEGTRCNIFAVINNTLCTPDLSRAGVHGVMRSFLIERMQMMGIALEVRPISKQELSLASELFVCNSVFGVWPVARILSVEKATANVEVQFASRQMADVANKAVQEIFSL
jgi:4-amino-4-deoxychorismate lyase